MNEYSIGDLVVKHYDLYRLKSTNELTDLNLFEENVILQQFLFIRR